MNISDLLLGLLAERIGVSDPDPDQLFIDHGVGSLDAEALAAQLEERLNVRLPSTVFYDHPSPRALAAYLERLAAPGGAGAAGAGAAGAGAGAAGAAERSGAPAGPAAGYGEPVAVTGIGCRVPGAEGPRQLWELLERGGGAVGPVPAARAARDRGWAEPGVGRGGFLPDIEGFDPGFFGVNTREAAAMDPQQRMLLEVSHEALQDAGLPLAEVSGRQTGVYIGVSSGDFLLRAFAGRENTDSYAPTGAAFSVNANRISYTFDLHGPSIAIDTACSSSLVAVHQAVWALRTGQCDTALAGGVNALLGPHIGRCFSTAGVLAPDGQCKSFGSGADGMGRSEGAVVVVLRRLSDALADGDRVYALIRGGAINSDGRTNGLMSPSAPAQVRLLRAAYAATGTDPGEVDYVEGHGSGTRLGDLMELRALSEVLGTAPRTEPLRVGSVKSNVSHLEAAAGAAGLAKVALALHRGTLPASTHTERPATDFDWETSGLRVQRSTEPWAGRLAGVSSFGFGGTNAHLVLEAPPAGPAGGRRGRAAARSADRAAAAGGASAADGADAAGVRYLPLSAHTPAELRRLAERWRELLADPELDLAAALYTAGARRDHHPYRLAVAATDPAGLRAELDRVATAQIARPPEAVAGGGLAVVFTADPTGAEAAGAEAAGAEAGTGAAGTGAAGTGAAGTGAVQAALASSLRAAGLVPDLVVGHGAAEVTAARYCGVLTPAEAERLAEHRAKLLASLPPVHAVEVQLAHRLAASLCARLGPDLAVSSAQAPGGTVVVGTEEALSRLTGALSASTAQWRELGPASADHSALAAPLAADLEAALGELPTNIGEIPLVSTATGAPVDGRALHARHWSRQLSSPSLLGEALAHALDAGVRTFVEVGPPRIGPLLRAAVKGSGARQRPPVVVPCGEPAELPGAVTRLYELGHEPDWRALAEAAPVVSLPLLPWSRRWTPDPGTSDRPEVPA